MRMIPCHNGHYYDENNHSSCPYCSDSNTIVQDVEPVEKTMIYQKKEDYAIAGEELKTEMFMNTASNKEDSSVIKENELTAGWIVISSQKGRGSSYTLTYGMNTLGRSHSNHIALENGDNAISREKHATIIYDFENCVFYIQHNDGKYLTYLNGALVSGLTELKERDRIKIGHTEFIFMPLCSESFSWEKQENQDNEN